MEKLTFKEAKEKFSKRAFWGCLLALAICWFMKLFGISYFNLDLNNKAFNTASNFISSNGVTNIYYTITLMMQFWLLYCIVHRERFSKKSFLYILLMTLPSVAVRVTNTNIKPYVGNLVILIEFIYMIFATAKFKLKKVPRAIFINAFIIVYEALSVLLRDYEIKAHTYNLIAELILSIYLYILLILHREVSLMDGGTWFIFGFTAWLYAVAGFIVGLFKLHPIRTAKEYYAKGKAKEDARKTEKANRKAKAK